PAALLSLAALAIQTFDRLAPPPRAPFICLRLQSVADRLHECVSLERLGEVVDRPRLPGTYLVVFGGADGEHHDRHVGAAGVGRKAREDVPTIEPRHHDVEHDDVRPFPRYGSQGTSPVVRFDHGVAVGLERDAAQQHEIGLIVHHQNDRWHRPLLSLGSAVAPRRTKEPRPVKRALYGWQLAKVWL